MLYKSVPRRIKKVLKKVRAVAYPIVVDPENIFEVVHKIKDASWEHTYYPECYEHCKEQHLEVYVPAEYIYKSDNGVVSYESDVVITPKGAYWDKFNSEEFVTWAKPADSNVVWYDKKNIGITRYRKTEFIRGRVLSLVGVWAYHWGHCMYQFLPKLFSAGEAGLLDDSITILVVENEDATIMEIINSYLTNYPNAKIKFIANIISDLSLKKFYQHGGPTNKLYITKVVKDNAIRFDTSIRNYEDLIFNLNYLSHMKAIIYSESTEYVYDIGNSSASKTYNGVEGEMKLYSFYSEALEMFDLTLLNDRKIIDYKNAFVVRSLKSLYFPGCEQKSFCEKYNYLKILSDRVTPHFSYGESLLWKSMLRLLRYRLLLLTHICCACLGGIKKAKLE